MAESTPPRQEQMDRWADNMQRWMEAYTDALRRESQMRAAIARAIPPPVRHPEQTAVSARDNERARRLIASALSTTEA